MKEIIQLHIRPISVNESWQGKRYKTSKYKEWEKEMLYILPKRKIMNGDLEVQIIYYFKHSKKRDIDNPVKPTLDCLQKKGYFKNDNQIVKLAIEKKQRDKEGMDITFYEKAD